MVTRARLSSKRCYVSWRRIWQRPTSRQPFVTGLANSTGTSPRRCGCQRVFRMALLCGRLSLLVGKIRRMIPGDGAAAADFHRWQPEVRSWAGSRRFASDRMRGKADTTADCAARFSRALLGSSIAKRPAARRGLAFMGAIRVPRACTTSTSTGHALDWSRRLAEWIHGFMATGRESPSGGLTQSRHPPINPGRFTPSASCYKRAATAPATEDP
jgi:hypothetical protein